MDGWTYLVSASSPDKAVRDDMAQGYMAPKKAANGLAIRKVVGARRGLGSLGVDGFRVIITGKGRVSTPDFPPQRGDPNR